MHLQDCISDNLSGAIAKQEVTKIHTWSYNICHAVSSTITSRNIVNKTFYQVALNRIGILWEVLGRFGWFCWWL